MIVYQNFDTQINYHLEERECEPSKAVDRVGVVCVGWKENSYYQTQKDKDSLLLSNP